MVLNKIAVKTADVGLRADVFVASKYPEFARSALLKLFDGEFITINGQKAKPGYKLKKFDKLAIDESILTSPVPKISLPIVFEDKNVIVIDKPSGVLSHSNGGLNFEASVASFIRENLSLELKAQGQRAGIVHRLDRATSGVMICAKNASTLSYLQKQFQNRRTKKTYIAICKGRLEESRAVIDAPIKRIGGKSKPFWVDPTGKDSITEYETVKAKKDIHWLNIRPYSGRTHQIRVHMAFLRCPVVGDSLYDGQAFERLMLHASSIEINLPGGEQHIFQAKTPTIFNKYWKNCV